MVPNFHNFILFIAFSKRIEMNSLTPTQTLILRSKYNFFSLVLNNIFKNQLIDHESNLALIA